MSEDDDDITEPCPFCGGTRFSVGGPLPGREEYVQCLMCYATGPSGPLPCAAWNTRNAGSNVVVDDQDS